MPIDPYGNVWPPPHWSDVLTQTDPMLQPGLGVPTSLVDAAMPHPMPSGSPDPQQLATANMQPPAPSDAPPPPPQDSGPGAFDSLRGAAGELGTAAGMVISPSGTPTAIDPVTGSAAPSQDAWTAAHGSLDSERSSNVPVSQAEHDAGDKAEIDRVAALTPEQYAIEKDRHDQLAAVAAHDSEMKARLADLNQTKANVDAHLAATAKAQAVSDQIQSDALKLANTKVDPEQWMNSKSTPQKILTVIAAVIGGLAAGRSGGRNVALDMIQKSIDENIAAQGANLSNQWKGLEMRKGGAAEQLARGNDAYQAAETVRLASWEYAKNQLVAEQANYNPRGTTALRIGGTIQQIHAKQAEILTKQKQQTFENEIKLADVRQKAVTAAESVRHNQKEEALTGWGHALQADANKGAAADRKLARQDRIDAKDAAKDSKDQDRTDALGIPGLTYKDDKGNDVPFIAKAGDVAELGKLRTKVGVTHEVVSLMDQIVRKRSGWSSATGNSDEHQELETLNGSLDIALKNAAELGAVSGNDMKLVSGMKGFESPTQWHDLKAGIKTARQNMIGSAAAQLKTRGYPDDKNGKGWDIPDLQQNAPTETPEDAAVKQVLRDPMHSVVESDVAQYIPNYDQLSGGQKSQALADLYTKTGGMMPNQRKTMEALGNDALGDDPVKAKNARENLAAISKDAEGEGVRDFAQALLQRGANDQLNSIPANEQAR